MGVQARHTRFARSICKTLRLCFTRNTKHASHRLFHVKHKKPPFVPLFHVKQRISTQNPSKSDISRETFVFDQIRVISSLATAWYSKAPLP